MEIDQAVQIDPDLMARAVLTDLEIQVDRSEARDQMVAGEGLEAVVEEHVLLILVCL